MVMRLVIAVVVLAFLCVGVGWCSGWGICSNPGEEVLRAEGKRIHEAIWEYRFRRGTYPESLDALSLSGLEYRNWSYRYWDSPERFGFQLRAGDYVRCNWAFDFNGGGWRVIHDGQLPSIEVAREARELFDLVEAHERSSGDYPADLGQVGVTPDWGDRGPWRFEDLGGYHGRLIPHGGDAEGARLYFEFTRGFWYYDT